MAKRHPSRLSRPLISALEPLESRRLLSTVALLDNGDGSSTLKITGTNSKDTIVIYDDPANNFVEVVDDKNHNDITDPGEDYQFPNANLHNVNADMKKGDDSVEIQAVSTYVGQQRSFDIDLRQGNDHFLFVSPTQPDVQCMIGPEQVEPNGANITNQSDISFTVEGEDGNDHLTFDLSRTSIIGSAVSINADTEAGNDTVDLTLPDNSQDESGIVGGLLPDIAVQPEEITPISGPPAELQVQIDLGSGNDKMNLTTLTGMTNAAVGITILGDTGNDTFNDNEDFGLFEATFAVTSDLGAGNDSYNAHFAIGDGRAIETTTAITPHGSINLVDLPIEIQQGSSATFNIQGSTGKDNLVIHDVNSVVPFSGTQIPELGPSILPTTNINGTLDLQEHGGAGDDNVVLDLDPTSIVTVGPTGVFRGIVSGDDGKDRCRLRVVGDGGAEAPVIAQDQANPFTVAGTFDLAVMGGGDNDKISAAVLLLSDAINTPAHYGPRGAVLVDGGRGTDRYDTEGNGIFSVRGVETLDKTLEKPFI